MTTDDSTLADDNTLGDDNILADDKTRNAASTSKNHLNLYRPTRR